MKIAAQYNLRANQPKWNACYVSELLDFECGCNRGPDCIDSKRLRQKLNLAGQGSACPVEHIGIAGHHHDAEATVGRQRLLRQGYPVNARHLDIRNEGIEWAARLELAQGFLAIVRHDHDVSVCLKRACDEITGDPVVIGK